MTVGLFMETLRLIQVKILTSFFRDSWLPSAWMHANNGKLFSGEEAKEANEEKFTVKPLKFNLLKSLKNPFDEQTK